MSRYLDIITRSSVLTEPSSLPIVDWSQVGQSAPTPIAIASRSPSDPLPKADVVILTWTENEWTAFDHVFLRSAMTQPESSQVLTNKWFLYSRQAPSSSANNRLWGYFQLVRIPGGSGTDFTVLLIKSDSHLAHPPWLSGLSEFINRIIADVQPSRIYSIGTAGGANGTQRLGDVAITNAAKIQLKLHENLVGVNFNNQTFTSTGWFPNTDLIPQVQSDLFLPLSGIATRQALQKVLQQTQNSSKGSSLRPFALDDLLNPALDPQNLGSPKADSFPGTPLLTTDFYFIAESDTPYAALEEDDAVIAKVAGDNHVHFAFIRNISDPLIPSQTPSGKAIPDAARQDWSSAIYDHFGLYTSFNGALAAWATIAGSTS